MSTPKLFTPIKVGAFELTHRVVMAPLTRCRSDIRGIPNALMAEYYSQRTTKGGLIISEASQISMEAQGMNNTPGMYTEEMMEGWKLITNAVHEKGGVIFAQLWHMGRQSHSSFQPDGGLPVAPSAVPIKITSTVYTKTFEKVPYECPRALLTEEMPRIVADYVHAAKIAMRAGFDGVEVHAANAYLIDQFLHDTTNLRTDQYSGSIENRTRFLKEVVEAVVNEVGSDHVGVRLSPPVYIDDSDKDSLFKYAIDSMNQFNLAYLHLVNPMGYARFGLMPEKKIEHLTPGFFRSIYKGVLIECGALDRAQGVDLVAKGNVDMAGYGVPFISNPDLVYRLEKDLPLVSADAKTYFTPGPVGFTDYSTYDSDSEAKMATGA